MSNPMTPFFTNIFQTKIRVSTELLHRLFHTQLIFDAIGHRQIQLIMLFVLNCDGKNLSEPLTHSNRCDMAYL